MKIMGNMTTWKFQESNWICWENMKLYQFKKEDFSGLKKTITLASFKELIDKNPLSWAMTSGLNIEYTLETPDKLLK